MSGKWTTIEAPFRIIDPQTRRPLLELDGEGGLALFNKKGEVWLHAGTEGGSLEILRDDGSVAVDLGLDPENGAGQVTVYTTDGFPAVCLYVHTTGGGGATVYNVDRVNHKTPQCYPAASMVTGKHGGHFRAHATSDDGILPACRFGFEPDDTGWDDGT